MEILSKMKEFERGITKFLILCTLALLAGCAKDHIGEVKEIRNTLHTRDSILCATAEKIDDMAACIDNEELKDSIRFLAIDILHTIEDDGTELQLEDLEDAIFKENGYGE
jgi:hypothetical protein